MNTKRILLIDDDKNIVSSFKEILELHDYEIETANTAKDGIKTAKAGKFNLALLDMKLPDMEGTELLEILQKDCPNMLKIMVTGFASLENAVKSLNLGAAAYIMKPVNPEELVNTIAEKLKEQENHDDINEEKVSDWIENRLNNLDEEE
jgi:DNA-binding NtrC family response regulator